VNEHVVEVLAASIAWYVTVVVVPRAKALPLAGPAVRVIVAPVQLSLAVGSVQVATASQAPGAVFTVMLVGQPLITGAVTSTTVTVKEQVEVSPAPSVAV
jgi:hypothetical protein